MKRTTYIIIGLFVLGLLLIPSEDTCGRENSSSFINGRGTY